MAANDTSVTPEPGPCDAMTTQFQMSPRHELEAMFRGLSPPPRGTSTSPPRAASPGSLEEWRQQGGERRADRGRRSDAADTGPPSVARSATSATRSAPPAPPTRGRTPARPQPAGDFVQVACDSPEPDGAPVPVVTAGSVTQSNTKPKKFGCDGKCGFEGSYHEVAEHERSCDKYRQMQGAPPAPGSIEEWRQQMSEGKTHSSRGSVALAQSRDVSAGFEHESAGPGVVDSSQQAEPANIPQHAVPGKSGQQPVVQASGLDDAFAQKDREVKDLVDAEQVGAESQPCTKRYNIAVDATSKLVDGETDLPYPVSPRAELELMFSILESGVDALPSQTMTFATEEETQSPEVATAAPVPSPRRSLRTWQERRMRSSPTPDDSAVRLEQDMERGLTTENNAISSPAISPGEFALFSESVTRTVESALDRAWGGPPETGRQDAGPGEARGGNSSDAIEISSFAVASPAPLAGALGEGIAAGVGADRSYSPRRVREHQHLLMQVLEQQKAIASMQVSTMALSFLDLFPPSILTDARETHQGEMQAKDAEIEMLHGVQAELALTHESHLKAHRRDALGHHLEVLMNSLLTARAFHLMVSQTRADCRSMRLLQLIQRRGDRVRLATAFDVWVAGEEDDQLERDESERVQQKLISAQNILAEVLMASPTGHHRRIKGSALVNVPLGGESLGRLALSPSGGPLSLESECMISLTCLIDWWVGGHWLSGPKHPVTRLHADGHARRAPALTAASKCDLEGATSGAVLETRKVEADCYRRSLLPPSTLQVHMQGLEEGDEDAATVGKIAVELHHIAAKNADEGVPTAVNWMSHGISAAPSGMC